MFRKLLQHEGCSFATWSWICSQKYFFWDWLPNWECLIIGLHRGRMGKKMPFISDMPHLLKVTTSRYVIMFASLGKWTVNWESESYGLAMETSIYNRKWFRKSGKNETNYSEFINFIRNTEHRRVASKFRIGNHNLKIETGRFTIPKTPEDLRICDHCMQSKFGWKWNAHIISLWSI